MNAEHLIRVARALIACTVVILLALAGFATILFQPSLLSSFDKPDKEATDPTLKPDDLWIAPDTTKIPMTAEGDLVRYGRELVAHTSLYLGPQGKVAAISNGMNCQNCHLKAGKKAFGNSYAAVASTYPKFRARSGAIESVEKRVNDCIERSLNGQMLDSTSQEMRAFVAYITWVGKDVEKGVTPKGAGIWDINLIDRQADKEKGLAVYKTHCTRCHGENGEGLRADNGVEWKYPPLYGENSYNVGAGLYRLSRLAGYVKVNMPNDLATFDKPHLTDEESWDVAAYINSMPRPLKDISKDWPDVSAKPFDHPFGPFVDDFPEQQHKYGPFTQIISLQKKSK